MTLLRVLRFWLSVSSRRPPPLRPTTGPLEAAGRAGSGEQGGREGLLLICLKRRLCSTSPPLVVPLRALIMEVMTLGVG